MTTTASEWAAVVPSKQASPNNAIISVAGEIRLAGYGQSQLALPRPRIVQTLLKAFDEGGTQSISMHRRVAGFLQPLGLFDHRLNGRSPLT